MGQYSTESRQLPMIDFSSVLTSSTGVVFADFKEKITAPQTTYSYRSGIPAEAIVTKADLLLGNQQYGSRYDNGHNFNTTKFTCMFDKRHHVRERAGGRGPVVGLILPEAFVLDIRNNLAATMRMPSFDSTLWGNRAIADTNPSASTGDLTVFLGEFVRDGLPSFVGSTLTKPGLSKRQLARKGGSEYLNLQFGWVPLIKDIEKALHMVKNSYKILAQYERDSGRHVRRSRSYPSITTEVDNPDVSGRAYQGNIYDPMGYTTYNLKTSTKTTQVIKFSGAYTYHIPVGKDLLGKAARYAALADKLLGIKLTPDRLWNLTPWSWLTDWWIEIGPALEARSALSTNGQVLQYGYLQRRTDVVKTYTYQLRTPSGPYLNRVAILRCTKKERVRATPFGFGITDEAITAPQMAILAALGISLGDGKLRKMGY